MRFQLGAQLVRLLSQAGTGYFYVKKRNPKKNPVKLEMMKCVLLDGILAQVPTPAPSVLFSCPALKLEPL